VHFPAFERPRPAVDMRWFHRIPLVLPAYYWACDRFLDVSSAQICENLTLVNSEWTGNRFRRTHGGTTTTLYPPVTGPFPDVPWATRDAAFVCLGRISPEKDIDSVIDILSEVRRTHTGITLRLVGSAGEDRYARHVISRVRQHQDWITLHLDVSHEEVRRLITTSRYGLHAMKDEHFGMAPAEMATGGCLVWVHDSGGQVEIVDRHPRLVYSTTADAVAKILTTLADDEAQAALRHGLAVRAQRFAVNGFIDGVRAAAATQLARQGTPADTIARNSG
jgi:glycosyltransferase involved in cell wall biosynthesis